MALIETTVGALKASKVAAPAPLKASKREVSAAEVFVKSIFAGVFLGSLGFLIAGLFGFLETNAVEIIALIAIMVSVVGLEMLITRTIKKEEAEWEAKWNNR